jgi:hypothetical protein
MLGSLTYGLLTLGSIVYASWHYCLLFIIIYTFYTKRAIKSTPFFQKKEINEAVQKKAFIYALRVRWVAAKGAATGIREEASA